MGSWKGHLLVASPELVDPNFARTVTLILEHSPGGAAGLVLNRPTAKLIDELAPELFGEELAWPRTIHLGGPVPGPLLILHERADLGDDQVIEGVYSTVSSEKLRELLDLKPEPVFIVANYAGWGPLQLEAEMEHDSWLTLPARVEHVFWDGARDLWEVASAEIREAALRNRLHLPEPPDDLRSN